MLKNGIGAINILELRAEVLYRILVGVAIFFVLYLVSTYNYLLFHSVAEVFSIVIAMGIFMVAWNTRKFMNNDYFLFVGISYHFIAILDLIHTFTYKGMGVIPVPDANAATQLWIAARYMQAISLFIAPVFLRKKINPILTFFIYLIISGLIIISVLYWRNFPVSFIEGSGLTQFKIISEYIISLILIATAIILINKRKNFDKTVMSYIIVSLLLTVASEIFFTFYISVYGISNMFGHLLKIAAFYYFYKAIIQIGLEKPFDLLFLDLKRKGNQLIQQKEKVEQYINLADIIFLVLDPQQKVTLINNKGCKILGYKKSEIIGSNWIKSFTPKRDRKKVQSVFNKLLKGKENAIHYFENPILTKSGEERIIAWHNSYIKNNHGKTVSVLSSGEDITDRKRMEKALRESERNYRKLFENQLHGIVLCKIITNKHNDPVNYVYVNANQAFEKYTGIKRKDILGKTVTEVIPGIREDAFNPIKTYGNVALTGKEFRLERFHKYFKRWYQEYVYSPKKGYFIIMFSEITKKMELEKRKNDFISIASHELKTPVTSIKIFSQILKKRLAKMNDEKDLHILSSLNDQVDRLSVLVNDLLDVSRIDDGKMVFNKKVFDLDRLIKKTILDFQSITDTHEIIKNGELNVKVIGDESRISQVLSNLISNAIKYSPNGKKVIVHLKNEIGQAIIGVEDFGHGIEKYDQQKIFGRFYRSENVSRNGYSGFGLGLYIASEIVKRHDGKIWIESEVGKGSKFYFSLPVNS